ncbi:putative DNA-binding protein [Bombilactobacillus bombi]|uniref:putative DNA-binding protein n=1 Tax=Bombilactobacillus bombi TaxID=1303590 RepID=UPI0015E5AC97|nr:putative DNA-binding protein [Bombilactobacillus bombi]MBA1393062.1 putative DNA-binding protein [Lactobacillus sp. XV13L]MBA1434715.1 putative DNA-binding protein [Bombilactobacillus bombi]
MTESIEKTTQINMLYDFYQPLLTAKQDLYMQLYYGDDYSLGEIAQLQQVSRQAVYDNLQRTVKILTNYEQQLHLYRNFQQREQLLQQLQKQVAQKYADDVDLKSIINELMKLE